MATQLSSTAAATYDESTYFCDWIQTRIDNRILVPGRAMVLGTGMLAATELLLRNGYQVTLVDPSGNDIAGAKQKKLNLLWAANMKFTEIKPWRVGHLDLVIDRNTLESLEPDERFAYANRMGRFLASGCHLVGLYRLGLGSEAQAPYSLAPEAFTRLMARYFISEHMEELPSDQLSATRKHLGMFERRSAPRRAPRPR